MFKVDWIFFVVAIGVFGGVLILYVTRRNRKLKKVPSTNEFEAEELKQVYDEIVSLIHSEKYFLKKNIKLSDLAMELNGNDRLISKAINVYGNANFNKFMNSFRVEHSKELLIGGEYDYYTIEAIAEESGFSNKVSFYNAFKSTTGMSPTQFRALKQSKIK